MQKSEIIGPTNDKDLVAKLESLDLIFIKAFLDELNCIGWKDLPDIDQTRFLSQVNVKNGNISSVEKNDEPETNCLQAIEKLMVHVTINQHCVCSKLEHAYEHAKGIKDRMEDLCALYMWNNWTWFKNKEIARGLNEGDANSIFQDAILAFLNATQCKKFRHESSPKTFFGRVFENLKNQAYREKMAKKNQPHRSVPYEPDNNKTEEDNPSILSEAKETQRLLQASMLKMQDPLDADIIILKDYVGWNDSKVKRMFYGIGKVITMPYRYNVAMQRLIKQMFEDGYTV